jgi:autotransporter-associated beta strand protein
MLELNDQNTYTGATIVSEGGLRPNPMTSLPTTSNLALAGGVLEGTGAASFTRALGTAAGQVQWTGSGGFSACTGKMVVNLGGHSPADVLTWNRNGFVPSGSDLVLGSGSADSEIELKNPIDLAGDTRRIFVQDNPYVTTDLATISGAISNGSMVKDGTGTLVLKAANTYLGPTTVMAGVLRVAAGGSLAGSTIDVGARGILDVTECGIYTLGAGRTLMGTGRVQGALAIMGTVAPGDAPGVLTVGPIAFADGSVLAIQLAGTEKGAGYNVLASDGTVTLQAGSRLDVMTDEAFAPSLGDTFDILDFSAIQGQFGTVNLPPLGAHQRWDTDDLYTQSRIEVVPEPATLSLLALGGLALLRRRR